ncbi:RimJ/RimL family protein N-acetyltransferase [Shewanella sp. GutCb]|uniref:GNAT family N-acetyltransferase n=1 Tax=Shewanella sp. GutCb TaxID=2058315 RepID=UPI000C797746|nr:GNAT family protein [Shewanella sp. GutCb]PKG73911.1 RimJ/RimL family protein N-acetyltransferase [Shewanella sp. GutCb]
MFTVEVEDNFVLSLVENSFAVKYFDIVSEQREYLGQWLAWPALANNEAFFANFIKQSLHDYADGKSLVCAMVLAGELVGNISFHNIDTQLKKVEIGYWLSCEHQGKGLVSKSVTKMIEIAFTELQMEKIEIFVAIDNNASRKVCHRLGFDLEGVITSAEQLNGRMYDHAAYALSRSDWLGAKSYSVDG